MQKDKMKLVKGTFKIGVPLPQRLNFESAMKYYCEKTRSLLAKQD